MAKEAKYLQQSEGGFGFPPSSDIKSNGMEDAMKKLLNQYFGVDEESDLYLIDINGKEWVEANYLFLLIGVDNERNLLGNSRAWPEMNLTDDDKCKVSLTGDERHANWYVSETGFWKIVARSRSLWAASLRASFLPTLNSHSLL